MQNELLLAKKNEYSKISMTSYFKWVFTGTKDSLPSSLPRNFPNHTEDDLNEKRSRIISIGKSQEFYFKDNFVKTSKYEIWNFLPKFLFEEFNPRTKIANCYFLVISCLQCIRQISNTNGLPTTLIPLTFVVVVDAIFQILEDVARHRADKDANSSPTRKFDYDFKNFVNIKWSELAVGDVVQIFSRETIPSDVLIIGVSEKTGTPPQGQCYVETKSLDGETNLKLRNALPSTYSHVIN